MNTDPQLDQNNLEGFRQLPAMPSWGRDISINNPLIAKATILTTANRLHTDCFGYFLGDENDPAFTYHVSKYPRQKYDPSNDSELEALANQIAFDTNSETSYETIPTARFTIVLGLEEGYKSGIFHAIDEVQSYLGQSFKLKPVEIFSIRNQETSTFIHEEPGVQIQGDDLNAILRLALALKQERLAVEDNKAKTAYIIETPLCSSPDL